MTQPAQTQSAPATPTTPADDRPTNPYANVYAYFTKETADHVLTVHHAEGLRRQVRVGIPGTSIWSWGVTTWPGYLATFGDIADGFMFTRVEDMFDFFDRSGRMRDYYSDGAPCIDVRYWAQKLSGRHSGEVRVYSSEVFLERVREALKDHEEYGLEAEAEHNLKVAVAKRVCARNGIAFDTYLADLRDPEKRESAISLTINASDFEELEYFGLPIPAQSPAEQRALILHEADQYDGNEHEAFAWINESGHFEDTSGWDLTEFDFHFVLACYAIDLTVQLWREHEKKVAAAAATAAETVRHTDDYILVEGGLVQNTPTLPIFDIDVLSSDFPGHTSAAEAVCLYGRIAEHPQASVDLAEVLDRIVAFVSAYGTGADVLALHAHEMDREASAQATTTGQPVTTNGVSKD